MAFFSVVYGVLAYAFFLATFLYAIGFVGNVAVPKAIDSGAAAPLAEALIVNLLAARALRRAAQRDGAALVQALVDADRAAGGGAQHLRARRHARPGAALWQWRPIAEPVVWRVQGTRRDDRSRPCSGWAGRCCCISTFLINHFELFGLRQVFARLTGRPVPEPEFRTPLFYRHVRHPIYLGFLLAFWAAPVMTAGHLLFAIATTGYILIGIWFEERDLIAQFGDRYRLYRQQVGMLLPLPRRKAPKGGTESV